MPRTPEMIEGEWYHLHRKWRQQCCGCGLVHDWDFRIVDNKIEARIMINERGTAAARRKLRKKVVIVE